MAFEFTIPHAFSYMSVRAHAPSSSGVYGISNAKEWIYIGQADNIRERLLQHLTDADSTIRARTPTGFTFELCDSRFRAGRQDQLVMQYEPICNRQDGDWNR